MIPAGQQADTIKSIAERYGVAEDTALAWAAHPRFPAYSGTPRRRQFLRGEVDAWVREHGPARYRASAAPAEQPAGDPRDLLDPDEVAAARAARLGSPPVSADTISSYVSAGSLPQPDRRPRDGLEPPVARNSWYRSTVDAHLATLRGPGNRTRTPRTKKPTTETT